MKLIRAVCFALLSASTLFAQAVKPRIATEADLPRFSYPVTKTVQQLVTAPLPEFLAFAKPAGADVDKLLTTYQITDHGMLRKLLEARLGLQLIEGGHDREALATIAELRSVEDKPAEKLTALMGHEVFARTRMSASAVAGACPAGYGAAFQTALSGLPWSEVAPAIQTMDQFDQVATPQLFIGFGETHVDPMIAKQHAIGLSEAMYLIRVRTSLLVTVPCAAPELAALTPYLAAHTGPKQDIWAAREIVFPDTAKLTPVNVAIWDSGIDDKLFPGRLYTNPAPEADEDPHGIAFDVYSKRTHGELMPLTAEQSSRYPEMVRLMQGAGDLQTGADTPAAAAYREYLKKMSPEQMRASMDLENVLGGYVHGTHVTSIAARGNPAVRLAYVRLTYDTRNPRLPPSEEFQQNIAAEYKTTIPWMEAHGIRVVNMSWWDRPSNIEKDLADNGIGKDAAERKALARRYFKIERDALYQAIQSAPGILFVTIAGNNNADNAFEECMPSSFVLPNLIVTGAVDQAGDATNFTSYGENVAVDANGSAVAGLVPGGATVRESGTSMAAPQVTNLAAKLLAVDPKLTPVQLIQLIREGATASADGRRHLIDPARSMQIMQQRYAASVAQVGR